MREAEVVRLVLAYEEIEYGGRCKKKKFEGGSNGCLYDVSGNQRTEGSGARE